MSLLAQNLRNSGDVQKDTTLCISCSPLSFESSMSLTSGYKYVKILGCVCGIEVFKRSNGNYYLELKFDYVVMSLFTKKLKLTVWAHDEEGNRVFGFVRQRSLRDSICLLAHESYQVVQKSMAIFCKVECWDMPTQPLLSSPNSISPVTSMKNISYFNTQMDAFEHELLADCEICVGEKTFKVAKFIIGVHSKVLLATFQHEAIEKKNNRVIIKGVEPKLMEAMLRYIYTNEVKNLFEIDADLLLVADRFAVNNLIDICVESIIKNLTIERLPKLMELIAFRPGFKRLESAVNNFFNYKMDQLKRKIRKSPYEHRMFAAFCDELDTKF